MDYRYISIIHLDKRVSQRRCSIISGNFDGRKTKLFSWTKLINSGFLSSVSIDHQTRSLIWAFGYWVRGGYTVKREVLITAEVDDGNRFEGGKDILRPTKWAI